MGVPAPGRPGATPATLGFASLRAARCRARLLGADVVGGLDLRAVGLNGGGVRCVLR
jgi:hypothetical protein